MATDSPLIIPLVGLLYVLGFGALSHVRRQGLPVRFAVEGLIITAVGIAVSAFFVPIYPPFFLIGLYLITMRVRLLVDIGNWLSGRGKADQALTLYRLALQAGPDMTSRQIVLINRGVALLRSDDPEEAYATLTEALRGSNSRLAAKHLAASYYNLGLACRRTGREAEAIRRFNEAIAAWPNSIFGKAASRELRKGDKDT